MVKFKDYNLESFGGKKLSEIELPNDVEHKGKIMVEKVEQEGVDRVAELAFLTRVEILGMLNSKINEQDDSENRTQIGRRVQYEQAFDSLLAQKSFQLKLAYYRQLLASANTTLQAGLQRHGMEAAQLNGSYLGYKSLLERQHGLEQQLEDVMSVLFAERGRDPDSMLVQQRQSLEEDLREIESEIEKLKIADPDTAAYLQYEKVKAYSRELEDGFAWTESRKQIVNEALNRAMASRPLIVLMGESGVGKTALAKALSRKLTGLEPEREVGGKDYRLRDLIGARAIDEQGDYLKFGPLLRAMTGMETSRDTKPNNEGGVYFDDEFNTRPVEVQRQILKFVSEAKPGQWVTVPATELRVMVQPKFLYLAAGNPNNARYDREETPLEAYREFSGVLDVDYLEQTKDQPELMEVMVASLMDQKTRRLRVISREEVMPYFRQQNGVLKLDETPGKGGFLWKFSQAWKGVLQAFAHQQNPLHLSNPAQPREKYYLQKFVLDLGKVRDWMHQYKISGKAQRHGIETYLVKKLNEELKSYPREDQVVVGEMMKHFGIDLVNPPEDSHVSFTVMTPKDIGYLFPNVARPQSEVQPKSAPAPEPSIIELDENGDELPVSESEESMYEAWLGEFKVRFDALSQLHPGITWVEVERTLKANPQAMKKLKALDDKGHAMNVFGKENEELIFASAWVDCGKVATDHKNIAYDYVGEEEAGGRGEKTNGNAVDIVQGLGVDLAEGALHNQLRAVTAITGWAWLKTDVVTRRTGYAFLGRGRGVNLAGADFHDDSGSFRAVLRVKKIETAELFSKLELSYDEMVDTLREFGFDGKPPSKQAVMDAIRKLSPVQLEAIRKFGKPMICITPAGSFAEKVAAIDAHKQMQDQNDTYLIVKATDPIWGPVGSKMVVTVVDGLEALPSPSFITNDMNIGQKLDKYEEEFARVQLQIMSTQEGAMIMMQSLKAQRPVDDYGSTKTVTYYNRAHLTKGAAVSFGHWHSSIRQVFFYDYAPAVQCDALRCRPSVRVLET